MWLLILSMISTHYVLSMRKNQHQHQSPKRVSYHHCSVGSSGYAMTINNPEKMNCNKWYLLTIHLCPWHCFLNVHMIDRGRTQVWLVGRSLLIFRANFEFRFNRMLRFHLFHMWLIQIFRLIAFGICLVFCFTAKGKCFNFCTSKLNKDHVTLYNILLYIRGKGLSLFILLPFFSKFSKISLSLPNSLFSLQWWRCNFERFHLNFWNHLNQIKINFGASWI